MAKWMVTRSIVDEWELEAETGPEAIKKAQDTFSEAAGDTAEAYYEAVTEEGQSPCEGCGKPATCADSEGVPLCKVCFDDMLNEPDTYGEDPLGGSGIDA